MNPVPELMENYTSFDTPHSFPSGVELSSHFIYYHHFDDFPCRAAANSSDLICSFVKSQHNKVQSLNVVTIK